MVALPAADFSYDYKYFASQADAIILMNYDFHWPTSSAGPIAPQDWFERNIENMVKLVPPDKIVMGIANYGYDWPAKTTRDPHPVAQAVTFQQGVVTRWNRSRTSSSIRTLSIRTIPTKTKTTGFTPSGCSTASPPTTRLRAAERAGVRGTALWRLGMEDPSMWSIWDCHPSDR